MTSRATTGSPTRGRGFAVFTALVVWGAIPFVAITVYAGLAQVPQELLEAAAIDGARPVEQSSAR